MLEEINLILKNEIQETSLDSLAWELLGLKILIKENVKIKENIKSFWDLIDSDILKNNFNSELKLYLEYQSKKRKTLLSNVYKLSNINNINECISIFCKFYEQELNKIIFLNEKDYIYQEIENKISLDFKTNKDFFFKLKNQKFTTTIIKENEKNKNIQNFIIGYDFFPKDLSIEDSYFKYEKDDFTLINRILMFLNINEINNLNVIKIKKENNYYDLIFKDLEDAEYKNCYYYSNRDCSSAINLSEVIKIKNNQFFFKAKSIEKTIKTIKTIDVSKKEIFEINEFILNPNKIFLNKSRNVRTLDKEYINTNMFDRGNMNDFSLTENVINIDESELTDKKYKEIENIKHLGEKINIIDKIIFKEDLNYHLKTEKENIIELINEKINNSEGLKIALFNIGKESLFFALNNQVYLNYKNKITRIGFYNLQKIQGAPTLTIKSDKNDYYEEDKYNNFGHSIYFLEDLFSERTYIEYDSIKEILSLEDSLNSFKRNELEKNEMSVELRNILSKNIFFKKLLNEELKNNYIISQNIKYPKNKKGLSLEYTKFENKIINLIKNYDNKIEEKMIKEFVNLLFIYSIYKNINISKYEININIMKETIDYIYNIKELKDKLNDFIELEKDSLKTKNKLSELKNEILNISKKTKMEYLYNNIKAEKKLIEDFKNSLPKPISLSFDNVLKSYGYNRVNNLFIFLEGYVSFLSSCFFSEEDFINITKFNYFIKNKKTIGVTFGDWTHQLSLIKKEDFIKTTGLTNKYFVFFNEKTMFFKNLRNKIKGHGCYFNIQSKTTNKIEDYLFDNMKMFTEINNSLRTCEIEKQTMYTKSNQTKENENVYFNEKELILSFKKFSKIENYNVIEFYNYSNSEFDNFKINISEYLFYLKIPKIKKYFLNELNNYYVEKVIPRDYKYSKEDVITYKFHIDELDFPYASENSEKYEGDYIEFSLYLSNHNHPDNLDRSRNFYEKINKLEKYIYENYNSKVETITDENGNNVLSINIQLKKGVSIFDKDMEKDIKNLMIEIMSKIEALILS